MPDSVHESDWVTQLVAGSPLLLATTRKVEIGDPPKDVGGCQRTSKEPRAALTVRAPGGPGGLPALTGWMAVENGKRLAGPLLGGADPTPSQPLGVHETAESWACFDRDPRTRGAATIAGGDHFPLDHV